MLLEILGENIQDNRFLRLVSPSSGLATLEAPRHIQWHPAGRCGESHTRQRLPRPVGQVRLPDYNRGRQRRRNPEYRSINERMVRLRKAGRGKEAPSPTVAVLRRPTTRTTDACGTYGYARLLARLCGAMRPMRSTPLKSYPTNLGHPLEPRQHGSSARGHRPTERHQGRQRPSFSTATSGCAFRRTLYAPNAPLHARRQTSPPRRTASRLALQHRDANRSSGASPTTIGVPSTCLPSTTYAGSWNCPSPRRLQAS